MLVAWGSGVAIMGAIVRASTVKGDREVLVACISLIALLTPPNYAIPDMIISNGRFSSEYLFEILPSIQSMIIFLLA